jgi:hypothetical protein
VFADAKDGNLVSRCDIVARLEEDGTATFDAEIAPDALIIPAEGISPAHLFDFIRSSGEKGG